MKQLILFFALSLSVTSAFATVEATEESTLLGTEDNVAPLEQEEQVIEPVGSEVQREEDFEMQGPNGQELEYDPDVIGDDEIEIQD